jgi:hypothetical protein
LSEHLSGNAERQYRDFARGKNQRDELHASGKLHARIDFQSQRPAPHAATRCGVSMIQVLQVVFGKSRNVDAQFPVDFLSDIEKRGGSFAMP